MAMVEKVESSVGNNCSFHWVNYLIAYAEVP